MQKWALFVYFCRLSVYFSALSVYFYGTTTSFLGIPFYVFAVYPCSVASYSVLRGYYHIILWIFCPVPSILLILTTN